MIFHMRVDNKSGKSVIILLLDLIPHNSEAIESGKNWIGKIDVIIEVQSDVVSSLERICRGNNTASSLERSDDTCLGD